MFASIKKLLLVFMLGLSLAMVGGPALAQIPTVDQVYQAANAGRYIEAQAMLDQVIKAKPNSATAHFVQAQVYARQGFMNKARTELSLAEELDPSGKYAKPAALKELRDKVAAAPRTSLSDTAGAQPQAGGSVVTTPPPVQQRQTPAPAPAERRFPWGLLLGGLGLVAFIVWVSRMMAQRNAAAQAMQPAMNNGGGGMFGSPGQQYPGGAYSGGGGGGYPPGYGPGYGAPPQQPGMGSRIMGGLATGAAVGAGIVAAEAIARQFTHGDNGHANASSSGSNLDTNSNNWGPSPSNYDMGGNDFGVADSSSWDSGGGGGGDGGGGSWD